MPSKINRRLSDLVSAQIPNINHFIELFRRSPARPNNFIFGVLFIVSCGLKDSHKDDRKQSWPVAGGGVSIRVADFILSPPGMKISRLPLPISMACGNPCRHKKSPADNISGALYESFQERCLVRHVVPQCAATLTELTVGILHTLDHVMIADTNFLEINLSRDVLN